MRSSSAARRVPRSAAAIALLPCLAGAAGAQMAGVPVLQGAFVRPGLALGVNAGNADDGSSVGAAVAWGLGGGRFAVSAGAAAFSPPTAFRSPSLTYGARLAWNVVALANGAIGVTPFVGVGRSELRRDVARSGDDGSAATLRLPAGVSAGYRRALGGRGAIALFAAPMYVYARPDSSGASSDGVVRVAAGAEVGFAFRRASLGVTIGYEGGGSVGAGEVGPRGGAFGVGLALARSRR